MNMKPIITRMLARGVSVVDFLNGVDRSASRPIPLHAADVDLILRAMVR